MTPPICSECKNKIEKGSGFIKSGNEPLDNSQATWMRGYATASERTIVWLCKNCYKLIKNNV